MQPARRLDPTPPDVLESGDVYAPAEDSWLLLGALAADAGVERVVGARALDMGTGSGIAAAWLAREGAARVLAVDVSPDATRLARANATRLAVEARVDVVRGDLFGPVAPSARFDVVAFNAPYLPSEPEERVDGWIDHAFHGGAAGVEVPARFVRALPRHLTPDGRAYVVLSDRGDVESVRRAAQEVGLAFEEVARESFFFERILVYRLTSA